jgi:hypothetical protein
MKNTGEFRIIDDTSMACSITFNIAKWNVLISLKWVINNKFI